MKKAILLFIAILLVPLFGFTQNMDGVDYISPFNDGVAAIKKGNQWAFINTKGTIVVNFRDDLVLVKNDGFSYPIFNNDRCLITQNKSGISYFGYIDKYDKIIIKPDFLNATNFSNNTVIVLKLETEYVGRNEILGKRIVYHKYIEVIINTDGEIIGYLTEPVNVVLDKKFLGKPPKITSKFISDSLIATKMNNGKWRIKNINKLF